MGWVENTTPRPLYTRRKTGTYCTGGWVGPRAGLDRYGKSRPPPVTEPRTVQPVASRYIGCNIPASQVIYKYTVVILRVRYFCQITCQWHRRECLSDSHVESNTLTFLDLTTHPRSHSPNKYVAHNIQT
jgi:hypothetical protein